MKIWQCVKNEIETSLGSFRIESINYSADENQCNVAIGIGLETMDQTVIAIRLGHDLCVGCDWMKVVDMTPDSVQLFFSEGFSSHAQAQLSQLKQRTNTGRLLSASGKSNPTDSGSNDTTWWDDKFGHLPAQ